MIPPALLPLLALATADSRPPGPSWAVEFRAFSTSHLVTLLVVAALMTAFATLGVRWRGTSKGTLLRRGWIASVFIAQGLSCLWYLLPGNFQIGRSLPLELCDIAAWVAGFALLTRRRWLRSLLFFWGFGLCTQAFITPTVEHGPGHIRFWLFWVNHTQIVASAIYDLAEGRFRPGAKELRIAVIVSLIYVVLIVPFDIVFDVNYGFLGKHAKEGTIVEQLGDWPLRIGVISLLVLGVFALLWGISALCQRLADVGIRARKDTRV